MVSYAEFCRKNDINKLTIQQYDVKSNVVVFTYKGRTSKCDFFQFVDNIMYNGMDNNWIAVTNPSMLKAGFEKYSGAGMKMAANNYNLRNMTGGGFSAEQMKSNLVAIFKEIKVPLLFNRYTYYKPSDDNGNNFIEFTAELNGGGSDDMYSYDIGRIRFTLCDDGSIDLYSCMWHATDRGNYASDESSRKIKPTDLYLAANQEVARLRDIIFKQCGGNGSF